MGAFTVIGVVLVQVDMRFVTLEPMYYPTDELWRAWCNGLRTGVSHATISRGAWVVWGLFVAFAVIATWSLRVRPGQVRRSLRTLTYAAVTGLALAWVAAVLTFPPVFAQLVLMYVGMRCPA